MALSSPAMRRVSLRNIASHKLRLTLTVIAVVLGTAFISGAFMFTKALSNTFDNAVATSFDGVDVVLSPGEGETGIPLAELDTLRADEKIGTVNIQSGTTVAVGDAEGNALQSGGTSAIRVWYPEGESVSVDQPIVEGNAPEGPDQVLVNQYAAEHYGLSPGDRVIVVDKQNRAELELTGIYSTDTDQASNNPAPALGMSEASYIERYTDGEQVGQVVLSAAGDQSAEDLLGYVEQTYPQFQADTGEKLAEEMSEQISQALQFVNYFLVAFGLIGLLVGTFLIANTFSMIVAQRTKEFALLRALGASRRQITVSVVFEALVVGLLGSVVGVLAGMGLVALIKAVLAATGNELTGSGLGLSWQAVVIPIVLGTVVTILSAWAPAQRAGQVQPVEAMRSTEASTSTPLTARTILGVVLTLIGIGAAVWGALNEDWSSNTRAILVGVGLVAVIIGFFFAGPALSIPVVPSVGRVIGLPFGAVGKLAATNSRRNPRRVATTAFALTLGIALVTAIGMLGQTMKTSMAEFYEDNMRSDFVLAGPTSGQFPLPAETVDEAREVDGVAELGEVYLVPLVVDGEPAQPGNPYGEAIEGDITTALPLDLKEVAPGADKDEVAHVDGEEGFFATPGLAAERGWTVGETYQLSGGPGGQTVEAPLLGTFDGSGPMVMPVIATKTTAEQFAAPGTMQLYQVAVSKIEDADADDLRAGLEDAVKQLLVVQVMDSKDLAEEMGGAIDAMLNILYGMLALAVVIAVLGIVNTLTLNVIERRQEIGMLRAVGTQRRQVRTMIILEAVAIAIFGALAGIAIGLGLGWAFLRVLAEEGLDTLSVPWALIGWMLVGSAVVGVLAALWPAASAARTAPLDAIAED